MSHPTRQISILANSKHTHLCFEYEFRVFERLLILTARGVTREGYSQKLTTVGICYIKTKLKSFGSCLEFGFWAFLYKRY